MQLFLLGFQRERGASFLGGGGGALPSCISVVLTPQILALLQCRDEARRGLNDQTDIHFSRREAP